MNEEATKSYSSNQIVSFVILSLTSLLGLFVFWLFGYHQYLLCRNETTNENLKESYVKFGNPFDKGCIDNVKRLFRRDKRNWKPEANIVKEEPVASESSINSKLQRKDSKMRPLKSRQSINSS